MKRILLPLAALAMISACKKADPAPVATDTAMASDAAIATPAAMPTVGANARTTLQFAGDYRQTSADGKATSLALAADESYVWTDATGKVTKGKFSWYKDGSTILLDEAGGKGVYAVADGAVYKLASKDAPRTGFIADQMWTRAPAM